jgi:lipoyl-dependent peroxiredoxin
MIRTGKAHWQGNLKEGKGTVSTENGVLNKVNYSFKTRFEEGEKGTNPEELLAAAHAGCFTMAVAANLTKKGFNSIIALDTIATLTMENAVITGTHLSISGTVQDINENDFRAATEDAAKNCIISQALKIPVTSEAHLLTEKLSFS